jgi:hypothetical protein
LLTTAIAAFSARFDLECNRTLARTIDATYEFLPTELELPVPCYPVETVTRFQIKSSEAAGWTNLENIDYLSEAPFSTFHISANCIAANSSGTPVGLKNSTARAYARPSAFDNVSTLSSPLGS